MLPKPEALAPVATRLPDLVRGNAREAFGPPTPPAFPKPWEVIVLSPRDQEGAGAALAPAAPTAGPSSTTMAPATTAARRNKARITTPTIHWPDTAWLGR